MSMRIAVMSSSGNVGKSLIATELLYPRMKTRPLHIEYEFLADPKHGKVISGEKFEPIFEELLIHDRSIIDVASNKFEKIMLHFENYHGAINEIDLFIIPLVPARKQSHDSLNTINKLQSQGVSREKIRVIFNMAEDNIPIESQYADFLNFSGIRSKCIINPEAIINRSAAFDAVRQLNTSVYSLANSTESYADLLRSTTDQSLKQEYLELCIAQELACSINEVLDKTFKIVTT